MDQMIERTLNFWFGRLDKNGLPDEVKKQRWWQSTPEFDRTISDQFGSWIDQAVNLQLNHWLDTAEGRLANILLLDQFCRNVFRASPKAFQGDVQAEALVHQQLKLGEPDLPLVFQIFLFMPLMHSEQLSSQRLGLDQFQRLLAKANTYQRPLLEGVVSSAQTHHDIIAQFGRFPHRNQVLGRLTTEQEQAWLDNGGPRFGQ